MKKQESWFKTEVDFENSFKFWFALQWQNSYIQLFVLALAFLIGSACSLEGGQLWFCAIPASTMAVIGYKGFWQFFNDRKHGRTR